MKATLYQYPKCSTCRKAKAWLEARGEAATMVDLVANPPSAATLKDLWTRSGQPLRKLFNTSGESYRNGGFKDRLATMSDAEALAALAADGKLVKRPLLDLGHTVLIGFREADWQAAAR
ncbi:MAG: Spx/MgsR family RNA polymerase-binding regulatory protein [Myxococcota bacterium]